MTNDDIPDKYTTTNNGNSDEPANINAHLRNKVAGLEHALDAAIAAHQVPTEIAQALRAPMGTLHTITLRLGGQRTRVVVNPIGAPDPEREVQAWQDILQAVPTATTPGRQLRAMEPAIAAVEIGAAVLINTEQTRAAVRAALRMLRAAPFLIPAPVVWLWQKARSSPARTGTAAVVTVVAIGTAGMLATATAKQIHTAPHGVPTRLESVVVTAPTPPPPQVTPRVGEDKRDHDRTQPEQKPPPPGDRPAPGGRRSPGPADSGGAPDAPRPSPRSAPSPRQNPQPLQQAKPQEQSPTNRPPAQQPTRGAEATSRPPTRPPTTGPATQRPDPTTQAPRPTATATRTQTQPTQAPPTTPAPGGGKDCHLVDVDIHLPPIGVGLCL